MSKFQTGFLVYWAETAEILGRDEKFQTGTPIFLRGGYSNYTNTVNLDEFIQKFYRRESIKNYKQMFHKLFFNVYEHKIKEENQYNRFFKRMKISFKKFFQIEIWNFFSKKQSTSFSIF